MFRGCSVGAFNVLLRPTVSSRTLFGTTLGGQRDATNTHTWVIQSNCSVRPTAYVRSQQQYWPFWTAPELTNRKAGSSVVTKQSWQVDGKLAVCSTTLLIGNGRR